MEPVEQAAHNILALIEATYQPTHQYVEADPGDYRHLSLKFYYRTSERLAGFGFRLSGDVEDTTITRTPGGVLMPVLIRTMLSEDGTVMAALYHARIRPPGLRVLLWLLRKLPGKVVDMETECSDGSFVVTSNAEGASPMQLPSLISAEYLPKSASAQDVYARHSARVASHLAARSGVTARVVTSHEELVHSQNRMNALKAAFRGEIAGVTREELERLSPFGKSVAGEVHAAVRREQQRRAM